MAALTYDAGRLLCAAITQAGALDRKKVRDALASIQEFQGVTGHMKFQGTCDPVKSAVILQIKMQIYLLLRGAALGAGRGDRRPPLRWLIYRVGLSLPPPPSPTLVRTHFQFLAQNVLNALQLGMLMPSSPWATPRFTASSP